MKYLSLSMSTVLNMPLRVSSASPTAALLAGEKVRQGGVIIYPTDTVYGIGCDPKNPEAVKRVFAAKRRERKPMPILVGSIQDAERLVDLGGAGKALARRFWPGALTIVAPLRASLPEDLTAGRPKAGVRVPDHSVAIAIIRAAGGAVVGTSANLSGREPAVDPEGLDPELLEAVDLVVDGGRAPLAKASTVVEVGDPAPEGALEIAEGVWLIRRGAITEEELRAALEAG